MLRYLRWSLGGALVLVCACSVVSWVETGLPDSVLWFFYLLGNFRLQFLVCQVVAFSFLAIQFCFEQTRRKTIGLSLVLLLPFLLINLSYLLPYYATKPVKRPTELAQPALKLMLINIGPIENFDLLLKLIRSSEPALIGVVEHNREFERVFTLSEWKKRYPYKTAQAGYGLALYSQIPLQLKPSGLMSLNNGTSLLAEIQWKNQPISLLLTHPSVPLSPEALSRQKEQFSVLAKERSQLQENLILFGDFNSTTWQPHVQDLLRQSGLKDSMLGFGVQPSWMTKEPWVTVPIDHILVSQRFSVLKRFIGPEVGSDHRPVIVSLH